MSNKKRKYTSIKKRMDDQTNSRQKSFVFNRFATKEQKHLKIDALSSKDKYPFRDQKKYPRNVILHTKNYGLFTNSIFNMLMYKVLINLLKCKISRILKFAI